jgi:hypothetical protein
MRHLLFAVAASLILAVTTASAQDDELPKAELFFGYSHLNADFYGLDSERKNAPGWKAAVYAPINSHIGIDTEVAGNYRTVDLKLDLTELAPYLPVETAIVDFAVSDYTVFVGPRVSYGPLFLRAMIGGDYLHYKTAIDQLKDAQWSLAGSFGGGVRLPISKLLSFRAGLDYEIAKHDLFGSPVEIGEGYVRFPMESQNNLRFTVGVGINIFAPKRK